MKGAVDTAPAQELWPSIYLRNSLCAGSDSVPYDLFRMLESF